MGKIHTEPDPESPSLSQALSDLRLVCERVRDDMERVIGILDGIHTAKNVYELEHRLKSLIGRERYMTKLMRQWIARIEPLDIISQHLGKQNG